MKWHNNSHVESKSVGPGHYDPKYGGAKSSLNNSFKVKNLSFLDH